MLHDFLTAHRDELTARCRAKVAQRSSPEPTAEELEHGIPLFLDQLIETLRIEQTPEPMLSRKVSGPAGGENPVASEVARGAAIHGKELLDRGYTVEQVVHDYGDLCQAITGLAYEKKATIEIDEFRTLNRCLDNAIADAVTEYNYHRDVLVADKEVQALNIRLGVLSHELRGHLNTATLALYAIRTGDVGLKGSTGAILDKSLIEMAKLIDRSLSEVRMTAGLPSLHQLFPLGDFIADVKLSASLQAQVKGCRFSVASVDPKLAVNGDRDLLAAALGNLLQNAFKFTEPKSDVSLHAYANADRIFIDVQDHCGGLASGTPKKCLSPTLRGTRTRVGWDLASPLPGAA